MTPQYVLSKGIKIEERSWDEPAGGWRQRTSLWATYVPGLHSLLSSYREGLSEIENMGWASEYAEPGYTCKRGILFADWNRFTNRAFTILEGMGYEGEWRDEWALCGDCGGALRTSPDCYSYQNSWVLLHECEIVCLNCLDREEYLESIQDQLEVCPDHIDPGAHGYTLLSDEPLECGWHPGQNDDPAKELEELHKRGLTGLVLRRSEQSQFYTKYEIWQKDAEESQDEEAS